MESRLCLGAFVAHCWAVHSRLRILQRGQMEFNTMSNARTLLAAIEQDTRGEVVAALEPHGYLVQLLVESSIRTDHSRFHEAPRWNT